MWGWLRKGRAVALAIAALIVGLSERAYDQSNAPTNSLPNPYRSIENWAQMPEGRVWGSVSAVDIDPDGTSVWIAERCGAQGFIPPSQMKEGVPFNCDGSQLAPILKFNSAGKLVKSFGEGLLVFPHGLHVDREGNVWVTDGVDRGGKGQQVLKFSPNGALLMRLGKAGVAGSGPDEFNAPSAVVTAPNGDILVANGHGRDTNARIVKFSKDGKFIKTWGKKGSAPGELDIPHAIAMDSQGRLFVGDRQNNRIQIFDQDGKFMDHGRNSAAQAESISTRTTSSMSPTPNPSPFPRTTTAGDAVSGSAARKTARSPRSFQIRWRGRPATSAAEGVAADAMGNIYGAEVGPKRLMKYVKN
jgi:hypothetical protein